MPEHDTRDELETRMAEQTAELRRSREQELELRQILDLVPQLIAVYGPNRERLYANRVFLDYVGFTLEEWRQSLGRGRYLHPEDSEQIGGFFVPPFVRGS